MEKLYEIAYFLSDDIMCRFKFMLIVVFRTLRENKRMLDKSIREIERERQGLQTQEKKLIAEIKKSAKQGQMVRLYYFYFFF